LADEPETGEYRTRPASSGNRCGARVCVVNKKRPDNSDRLMSGDKSDCIGGVYRVSFSSLDARRSGGSDSPPGCHSLPPILAL